MADADGERSDLDEAAGWLRQLLASGPVKANDVYAAADAAGLSKDRAKRAKKKIRALAGKAGMDGPWYWALPEHEGDLDAHHRREHEQREGCRARVLAPFTPFGAPFADPSGHMLAMRARTRVLASMTYMVATGPKP